MSHEQRGGKAPILVSAAVIVEAGRVLCTQRKPGAHFAGSWELPGGKIEPGEDPRVALERELREELGVDAFVGDPVEVTFHAYEERDVLLLFFAATLRPGSSPPRALDVADARWLSAAELDDHAFLPADVAVLAKVRALLAPG